MLKVLVLLTALLHVGVRGHSGMTYPQPFTPYTCRIGREVDCPGPCDISTLPYGGANYFPPGFNEDWNKKASATAATYHRGQKVKIVSSRNNHAYVSSPASCPVQFAPDHGR
jgi:hypothetical protein